MASNYAGAALLIPHESAAANMQAYEWNPDGHWESSLRLLIAKEALESNDKISRGLVRRIDKPAPTVSRENLLRAHSVELVEAITALAHGASDGRLPQRRALMSFIDKWEPTNTKCKQKRRRKPNQNNVRYNTFSRWLQEQTYLSQNSQTEIRNSLKECWYDVDVYALADKNNAVAFVSSVKRILEGSSAKEDHAIALLTTHANSVGMMDEVRSAFLRDISKASLAASATVLQLAGEVMSTKPSARVAFADVRPAGHHSKSNALGTMCVMNSVMVAALKYAAEGKSVGVYDIDVHFGAGTHDIAMRWNEEIKKIENTDQKQVFLVDVYAKMYDKDIMRRREVDEDVSDSEAWEAAPKQRLRARRYGLGGWEIPADSSVVEGAGDLLLFQHDSENLTDDAIIQHTQDVVQYFKHNAVGLILVAMGFDAAQGDLEHAMIGPRGFKEAAQLLRRSGIPTVFALEGGYQTQKDACGNLVDESADSVFGKSVAAVIEGLTERLG